MFSHPYSIGFVLLLFFIILISLWRMKDKRKKEPLFLLVAFFLISCLASYAFLSWKEFSKETVGFISQYADTLGWLFPVLEEILKATILIFILELAQREFNEINDGIIYGAVVAMGFVFIENTVYAVSAPAEMKGSVLLIRSVFTNALHMTTTMYFGYFYANGYLNRNKRLFDKKKRSKPYQILRHIRSYILRYWKKLSVFAIPYALGRILTLHITREHILFNKPTGTRKPHRSGEFILEGFLGGLYLHWLFNFSAQAESPALRTLMIVIPLLLCICMYLRFNALNMIGKRR